MPQSPAPKTACFAPRFAPPSPETRRKPPMPRLAPFALIACLALPAQAETVVVFAAASLKTALDPIAAQFQADTGHRVTISYAGSNQLAKQIIAGAPADIFLSASPEWMDEVERANLLSPGTRRNLLSNTLVLVAHGPDAPSVPLDPSLDVPALLRGGKLSMAMVDAVPAGQYGRAALQSLGLWETTAPHVAQSDNTRTALTLVAMGEAPFGIVYATDAMAEPRVTTVATFPEGSHPPITYPVALTALASDPADKAFLAALASGAATAQFTAQGFQILN